MINTILSKLLTFWGTETESHNEPITIEIHDESEDTTENYLNEID